MLKKNICIYSSYMNELEIVNFNFRCNLCEENNRIGYNCDVCNYRLCTTCLNQLVNMSCPQCRHIIPQEIVIITNNSVEIGNIRGIYISDENPNPILLTIFPFLIILYLIAGYFLGYLLIQNHESILINFLLGIIFLSAIMFTFFFLITLLYSAYFYTD